MVRETCPIYRKNKQALITFTSSLNAAIWDVVIVMIMSHVTVASDLVEHMVFNPIDIFNIKNVGGI